MKRLRKFHHLPSTDQRLLIEAALLLGAIRLGLWLLPFQVLRRILTRATRATTELQADQAFIGRVAWAVALASRYVPAASLCLTRALAAHALLARRGCLACLRIGVVRGEEGELQAHAWVESQGRIVIGGLKDLSRYTPLRAIEEDGFMTSAPFT